MYLAPIACAASSITFSPCSSAMALIASMSAHWPKRCTGMIALVFFVIAFLILAGSMLNVFGIDVHEDRLGARPRDAAGRGEERERRADHLVAGPDPQRHQAAEQRIGAAGDADGVLRAAIRGQVLLKLLNARAEDEILVVAHFVQNGPNLLTQ